jgi:hypothetical protein
MAKINVLTVSGRPVGVVDQQEGQQMAADIATDIPNRKVGVVQVDAGRDLEALKVQLDRNQEWLWGQIYTSCALITLVEFEIDEDNPEMMSITYSKRDGVVADAEKLPKEAAREKYRELMEYGFAASPDNPLMILNMR